MDEIIAITNLSCFSSLMMQKNFKEVISYSIEIVTENKKRKKPEVRN